MKTTEFFRSEDNPLTEAGPCHGGVGNFQIRDLIGLQDEQDRQFLKFVHEDILPPGSSFGIHLHDHPVAEEEWYFCLEGEGIMINDGVEILMRPGDISVCRKNGSHGVRNESDRPLHLLVIYASPMEARQGGNSHA